jgi:hypothetical protein
VNILRPTIRVKQRLDPWSILVYRKSAKTKATVAYAALSNKLARAAFYIMRDNVEFGGKKLFA